MTDAAARPETAQTLDRGLRLLRLVADAPGGVTVTEAAQRLNVGRAVVYRLVGTLVEHGLVRRDHSGRMRIGAGVLQLARRAQPLLAEAALPPLRRLAEEVGATAHLTVAEGAEGVALLVVEPSWTQFHVAYRTGSRHPLELGAAGRAILAARKTADDAARGEAARNDAAPNDAAPNDAALNDAAPNDAALNDAALNVVASAGELQPGAHGVASPVLGVEGLEASVGVVALTPLDPVVVGPAVQAAAAAVGRALA